MKHLAPSWQKLLKTMHLLSSGIWLSCVVLLALLPITVFDHVHSGDERYMYILIYHFIDTIVLTGAAIITLLTGLVYSIWTKWGFFQHGWLVYKWTVTLFIIITGTFYLGPLSTELLHLADTERTTALHDPSLTFGQRVLLWAAVLNSILLVLAVLVSVYKPWKGKRKQQGQGF